MVPTRRLIEAGRDHFRGVYLGDDILEFEMSAAEGQPLGGVALREEEDAWFLILHFHCFVDDSDRVLLLGSNLFGFMSGEGAFETPLLFVRGQERPGAVLIGNRGSGERPLN